MQSSTAPSFEVTAQATFEAAAAEAARLFSSPALPRRGQAPTSIRSAKMPMAPSSEALAQRPICGVLKRDGRARERDEEEGERRETRDAAGLMGREGAGEAGHDGGHGR